MIKFFKKIENTLKDLASSDDPRKLGSFKKSTNVYAYELDKSNRLLYDVDFPKNGIVLIRVGDHKASYGSN